MWNYYSFSRNKLIKSHAGKMTNMKLFFNLSELLSLHRTTENSKFANFYQQQGYFLHCQLWKGGGPKPRSQKLTAYLWFQTPFLDGTACCVDLPSIIQYGSIYWRQALLWLHIFEATAMLAVESSVPTKSLVNQEHRLESAFQIILVHLSAFWNLDHYPDDLHLVILHGCNVTRRNRFQMWLYSAWD